MHKVYLSILPLNRKNSIENYWKSSKVDFGKFRNFLESDEIILEELKNCEIQLKDIKQTCLEQHESLQRLLLQMANHKMIHEIVNEQFICPMCETVINAPFEEFEQHVVEHFDTKK